MCFWLIILWFISLVGILLAAALVSDFEPNSSIYKWMDNNTNMAVILCCILGPIAFVILIINALYLILGE